MAQLLMQGTDYVNFIGRYCWVAAGEHGLAAWSSPSATSRRRSSAATLHQLAFPDYFQKHVERGGKLEHAHEHPGSDIGERLAPSAAQARGPRRAGARRVPLAACGEDGLRVFDIAFIDNKGFSERITTAPVSPLGQQFYVPTEVRRRRRRSDDHRPRPDPHAPPENREPTVHPLYGYLYVADKYEGLILVGAATTIDGNPTQQLPEARR